MEGSEEKGRNIAELTVAMFWYSLRSLSLLTQWARAGFMTFDTVGEQLTDCLPHFYQVKRVKNKQKTQDVPFLCSVLFVRI